MPWKPRRVPKETRLELIGDTATDKACDIVFVHGLDGDLRETWRHPSNPLEDSWPHWVAEEFPQAAVWTLGYEAAPSLWLGRALSIEQRATDLLGALVADSLGQRPLAFITHSMGGLLVKQMVRAANDHGVEWFSPIAAQTKLVVFVAVPHQGSDLANYLKALGRIFRVSPATGDLLANGAFLRDLNNWFRAYASTRLMSVLSFAEGMPTRGVWVVEPMSADFGTAGHVPVAQSLDHIEISKPRTRKSVVAGLTGLVLERFVEAYGTAGVQVAPDPAKVSPTLTYSRLTEIDEAPVSTLLADVGTPSILYSPRIANAVQQLHSRDRDPDQHFRGHPLFGEMDPTRRAAQKAWAVAHNNDILRSISNISQENVEALVQLLAVLEEYEAPEPMARRSLRTFGALAALRMIRGLQKGFDWGDGEISPWFEEYIFNTDGSFIWFDAAPAQSETGRLVFDRRYWIGGRVGCERQYEYVMMPLKEALPLFQQGARGDSEAFYTWVLPQLTLLGSHQPLREFPVKDWELFLLLGQHGVEWWSRNQACPWPDLVRTIDMAER